MAAKTTARSRLTPEQVTRILELLRGADSVELKLTVPASAHKSTIKGLRIDPVEAEPRQIFFFDTPGLDLDKKGIVVRARRIKGGDADTVIKLRPVNPGDLPKSLRRSGAFNVELDALPGGFVCSGTLKGRATNDEVAAVAGGTAPLSSIFSREQRDFFRKYAPKTVALDKLVTLGPTFVLKSRFFVKRLDRRVVAELWLYPDGSRILELSTKATPADAFSVAAEFRDYLERRGVDTGGLQETKTRTALDFFSAQIKRPTKARKSPRRKLRAVSPTGSAPVAPAADNVAANET